MTIHKVPTHIEGFDHLALGGLPVGRTTLVTGTPGSGKSIFASQFLAGAILDSGEAGVCVTFEEKPEDIRRNIAGFGWPVSEWESQGKWAFVDASFDLGGGALETGSYDLGALLARIEHAALRIGAKRIVLDSVGSIFSQLSDSGIVRRELLRIFGRLRELEMTTVVTAETITEGGGLSRHGVEEFAADNVVILRNRLNEERRQRTVEILKFRGTGHHKGESPFTIVSGVGIAVIPLSGLDLEHPASSERVSSGSDDLDQMLGGGFLKGSSILASGSTGAGKTLLVSTFADGGVRAGERVLLLAFEESPDQLRRNAAGWGIDYRTMQNAGKLELICRYPESGTLEEQLIEIKEALARVRPDRVAVDSLSALERIATERSFREFVIGLTAYVREAGATALYTTTTHGLSGGPSWAESHISTITDTILVLRYVEVTGEIQRALAVLKMRGSAHDKRVRQVDIDGTGLHLGVAFDHKTGVVSGRPTALSGT